MAREPGRGAGPAPGGGDRALLDEARAALRRAFGPPGWWPGETPFEVMVGAVLTQNTAWRRVVPAIANLADAGCLSPRAMHDLPEAELAGLIRPAGTFRVKARYLKALVAWLVDGFGADVAAALAGETMAKRRELLAIPGVGRETADSILLYAGDHPIMVVDAYTRRILGRHGLVDPRADYDAIREWFEGNLPPGAPVRNDLHAFIVLVGKDFCRPRRPRCSECPLGFLFARRPVPPPPDAR